MQYTFLFAFAAFAPFVQTIAQADSNEAILRNAQDIDTLVTTDSEENITAETAKDIETEDAKIATSVTQSGLSNKCKQAFYDAHNNFIARTDVLLKAGVEEYCDVRLQVMVHDILVAKGQCKSETDVEKEVVIRLLDKYKVLLELEWLRNCLRIETVKDHLRVFCRRLKKGDECKSCRHDYLNQALERVKVLAKLLSENPGADSTSKEKLTAVMNHHGLNYPKCSGAAMSGSGSAILALLLALGVALMV